MGGPRRPYAGAGPAMTLGAVRGRRRLAGGGDPSHTGASGGGRGRFQAEEPRESRATGEAQGEGGVGLPSHHDAVALAERLEAEGRPVIRRWKFLVLGANDEDDARDLARVVKQEAPAAVSVQTAETGPLLPFAQYGPISIW